MANSGGTITREDLITNEALKWGDEYAKELTMAIDKNKTFVESIKEINKLAGSMKMVETSREYKKAKQEEITLLSQASTVWKEQTQLENQILTTLRKRELANESTNRKLIEERVALQETNKEIRRQILERSGQIGSYKKLSDALGNVRNQAKNVKADMFNLEQQGKANTAEYERLRLKSVSLTAQTNVLDKGIKDIDKSLGLHQREVGNYGIATASLTPIFGRVNSQLSMMGLSLDSLANAESPFKSLISGVTAFGKATLAFMVTPLGLTLTLLGGLFALIRSNKDTVIEFNSGLLNVGKTTGIANEELSELGDELIGLSRELKTVGTPALLEYATVAGQLGVKGSANILKFSKALAMLETASNIKGEEGASQIARLLTLTDGGVQNIQDFGDEIVRLGNNFAATEAEILGNATAIAQNTGVYKVGRQEILAYATATKAVGVEAELTGSTIGRTLGTMEKAIRTGQNIDTIARITGQSVEDLKKNFREDSSSVLFSFVEGLNAIDNAGGSVNAQLESIGVTSIRDQRVIASLATGGFGTLAKAMSDVTMASGAMTDEFQTAQQKLENQFARVGIAWRNLVLTVENGEGVFSKTATFFTGFFADSIEKLSATVDETSLSWGVLTEYFKKSDEPIEKTEKGLGSLIKAFTSLDFWIVTMRKSMRDLLKFFLVGIPNGIEIGIGAFNKITGTIKTFGAFLATVTPEIGKYIKDLLNPFATANTDGLNKTFDNFKKLVSGNNKEITEEVDRANKERLDRFNQAYLNASKKQKEGMDEARRKGTEEELEAERERLRLLLAEQNEADKKKRAEYLKAKKELADADFALSEFRLRNQIEINKRILDDEKSTLDQSLDAFNENSQLEQALIRESAEKKLKDISWYNDEVRDLSAKEIEELLNGNGIKKKLRDDEVLIIEQYQASVLANTARFNKDKQALIDEEVKKSDDRVKAIVQNQDTELNNAIESRTKILQANLEGTNSEFERVQFTEQYEKDIFDLKVSYARKALEEQISAIEKLRAENELSKDIDEKLLNDLSKYRAEIANIDLDTQRQFADKRIELEQQTFNRIKDLAYDLAYTLIDLTNAIFDSRIGKIDEEIDELNSYYDAQKELAGDNERQQQMLEEERVQKENDLKNKRRKEMEKQAIFNKTMAIAEIGISLAKTITAINLAAAQMDALAAWGFGAVGGAYRSLQLGMAIGTAAAQTAIVLAAPIPKYEKGTQNHKGGLAEVAEVRPEVILEPNKKPYIISDRSFVNLPKGTKVIPSVEEYEKMQGLGAMMSLDMELNRTKKYSENQAFSSGYGLELLNEMKEVNKNIKRNKTSVNVSTQKIDIPHAIFRSNNLTW